ncbi:MAG: cell envelope integrity protein CreD [Thermoanaerobaculia bacterium]|nr:cell envelope integrity protein CreD [Thermoanaerobaculia bacterium]
MAFMILLLALAILAAAIGGAVWLIRRDVRREARKVQHATAGNGRPLPSPDSPTSSSSQLTKRAVVVGALGLAMIIPLALVEDVVKERSSRHQEVLQEISGSWGARQELRGPVLVVPFIERQLETKTVTDDVGRTIKTEIPSYVRRLAWVLPEDLTIDADLEPERRQRGIYETLVYTGALEIDGTFARPDLTQLSNSIDHIEWDNASIIVLLSDLRSLDHVLPLSWKDDTIGWESGVGLPWIDTSGFHAPVSLGDMVESTPLSEEEPFDFHIQFSLRGSEGFYFAPLGRSTSAQIASSWPDPSFQGSILPTDRTVDESGFSARWEIPQLAREYPQMGLLGSEVLDTSKVTVTGVRLFEAVSLYSLIERSVKYGILFIALTYMTFLVFELQFGARLHYVQYALIGAALSLFFLILLSLSEHIGFAGAYGAAAAVAIAIITGYTAAALRSPGAAITVCAMLTGLYGLLFTILHLADFALLMGTGLLTVVLILLMAVTRNLGRRDKRLPSLSPTESPA